MVCYKHTRDPAGRHECHEQIKLRKYQRQMLTNLPWCCRPLPLGGGADPKTQINPVSKDHVDPGVDLCIVQLIGEGTLGTTWPRIPPHGSHLLIERLYPVAEKALQKVHAHQPLLPKLLNELAQGLQPVEVPPSHSVPLVGLGDGVVTREHRERHVDVVP
jgi:hypothetical protein